MGDRNEAEKYGQPGYGFNSLIPQRPPDDRDEWPKFPRPANRDHWLIEGECQLMDMGYHVFSVCDGKIKHEYEYPEIVDPIYIINCKWDRETLAEFADWLKRAITGLERIRERVQLWGDGFELNRIAIDEDIRPIGALIKVAHKHGLSLGPGQCVGHAIGPSEEIPIPHEYSKINSAIYDLWLLCKELKQRNFYATVPYISPLAKFFNAPDPKLPNVDELLIARLRQVASVFDKALESPTSFRPKPRWDRTARTITIGGIIWKAFSREAENQSAILEAFERAGWPESIPNPLRDEELLRQTIKDFNSKAHKKKGPLIFRPNGLQVAWDLKANTPAIDLP